MQGARDSMKMRKNASDEREWVERELRINERQNIILECKRRYIRQMDLQNLFRLMLGLWQGEKCDTKSGTKSNCFVCSFIIP